MPPPPKRDAVAILVDHNVSDDFLKEAKECLQNIYGKKWFAESKDLGALILFNVSHTRNSLSHEHVCQVTEFVLFDPQIIDRYSKKPWQSANGNWIQALAVALAALEAEVEITKGIVTMQIVLISDFKAQNRQLDCTDDLLQPLIEKINFLNAYLYILGPQVVYNKRLNSYADIRRWSRNIELVDKSNKQLEMANTFIKRIEHGLICDLDVGWQIFTYYKKPFSPQAFLVPLSIGKQINIPQRSFRCVKRDTYPKVIKEGASTEYELVLKDDQMETVEHENTVTGFLAHEKLIVITDEVRDGLFKSKGPRLFELIGFTERNYVSESYLTGDGSSKVISENRDDENDGFHVFVEVLAQKDYVAIVRRRYMANTKPKMYALFPDAKERSFDMVELVYSEAIKVPFMELDPKDIPKVDSVHTDVVYSYLDQLDVDKQPSKMPINPCLLHSSAYTRSFKILSQKLNGQALDAKEESLVKDLAANVEGILTLAATEVKEEDSFTFDDA